MKGRIKILHAAETIKGGIETVVRHLINPAYGAEGEESYIFVFPINQVETSRVYGESKYNFSRTGRNIRSLASFCINFTRALLRESPDVVHLHSTFAGILGRVICIFMMPLRRPVVVYCPHAFAFVMNASGPRKKIYALIEIILSRVTSKIICVSRYEFNSAIDNGLPANKLTLIYNGTPLPRRLPNRAESESKKIRLLYVGRFDYQKGVDILCDALGGVPSEKFDLVVIGGSVLDSKDPPPKFPENSVQLGWISSSELEDIYGKVDALIVPSRWEGFAMTPLEGMAHGIGVISSDSTSLPELVQDGLNGRLFKAGDVSSLRDILMSISLDDLRYYGGNARGTVKNKFNAELMVCETKGLYRVLINSAKTKNYY